MQFAPVDALAALFAGLLTLAGLSAWGPLARAGELSVVLRMAVLAIVPVVVARIRARAKNPGKALRIFLDFYVVAVVVLIFDGLGPLIQALNPHDKDAALMACDRFLFRGVDPTVALERYATPFLSDVLTVCYALYYFHPIVLGGLLFADDRRNGRAGTDAAFPRFAFVVVFVFFVSYLGYFLVPAVGPRYTIVHHGPLPRGAVSAAIDHTLDVLEKNKRDCFPSGHTMVVLTVLYGAARRSKATFLGFFPFALGLIAGTVYGRYHYVTDVLAGVALTLLAVPAANGILALARRRPSEAPR